MKRKEVKMARAEQRRNEKEKDRGKVRGGGKEREGRREVKNTKREERSRTEG